MSDEKDYNGPRKQAHAINIHIINAHEIFFFSVYIYN